MSAIKSLLCNALDAIAEHNDLDTAEAQLRLALTAVLDLKAQRALQSNHHHHALAHADALIALFPSSPEGYRRKGDVFFEKLNYKQACGLYTTCLHLCQARKRDVAPLQTRLEETRARLNRKVDPWVRLPNELIESVFSHCPAARFTCLAVCKAWRHKLLSVGLLWQNLDLKLQGRATRGAVTSPCKYLGPSLHQLTIKTDRTLCSALSFLLDHRCTHIERLTIQDTSSYSYPPNGILQWPHHIDLTRLSGHLTELVIQSNAILKNSLCFLIASCPKLVKLAYRIVDEDEEHSAGVWQGSHATLSQPTPLRHLEWPLQEEILEKSEFIFDFCPQLQVLRIWPSIRGFNQDVSAFVAQLQRRCPALEQLILHQTADHTSLPSHAPLSSPLAPRSLSPRNGLCMLSLGPAVSLRDHDVLRQLIADSANTLEHLDLAHPVQLNAHTVESRLHLTSPMVKLHSFSLADQVPTFMRPLHHFLSGCQHLHTLQLRHLPLTVPIMDALLQLPLLHTLTFQYCSGGSHVYQHFAEGAAALGDACPLRSLHVEDWGKAPRVLLEPLSLSSTGKLRTLQHLVLFARYGEGFFFETMDWQMFISNAQRSGLTSRLLTLEVDANERIYTKLNTSFIADVTYRVQVPDVALL